VYYIYNDKEKGNFMYDDYYFLAPSEEEVKKQEELKEKKSQLLKKAKEVNLEEVEYILNAEGSISIQQLEEIIEDIPSTRQKERSPRDICYSISPADVALIESKGIVLNSRYDLFSTIIKNGALTDAQRKEL